MGIEPMAPSLECLRSPSELFPRNLVLPRGFEPQLPDPKSGVLPLDEGRAGSESWVRTNDPLVNSQVLYRLSYPRKIGLGGVDRTLGPSALPFGLELNAFQTHTRNRYTFNRKTKADRDLIIQFHDPANH